MLRFTAGLLSLTLAASASAVTLDWVAIGDPFNAGEPQTGLGAPPTLGRVIYSYEISKYEITNDQYAEFLNAVAATDTNALYNTSMASAPGGIIRAGSS